MIAALNLADSPLVRSISQLHASMRPVIEQAERFNDAMRPHLEAFERIWSAITPMFQVMAQVQESLRPILASAVWTEEVQRRFQDFDQDFDQALLRAEALGGIGWTVPLNAGLHECVQLLGAATPAMST